MIQDPYAANERAERVEEAQGVGVSQPVFAGEKLL